MRDAGFWERKLSGRLLRRRVVQGGLGLTALGLVGCAAGGAPAPTAAAGPAGAPAPAAPAGTAATVAPAAPPRKYGGTFRTTANLAPQHEDFHQATGALVSVEPVICYSGLMRFKSGKDVASGSYIPIPDLAESVDQPDETTYVFKLRRGVKFQNIKPVNGRELVAGDVQYSYQRVLDLKV